MKKFNWEVLDKDQLVALVKSSVNALVSADDILKEICRGGGVNTMLPLIDRYEADLREVNALFGVALKISDNADKQFN